MDDRLIGFETVRELVGKSRTTLWRWEQEGKFPQRVQIGPNSVSWIRKEVLEWIAAKAAQRLAKSRDTIAPTTSAAASGSTTTARAYKGRGNARIPAPVFYRRRLAFEAGDDKRSL